MGISGEGWREERCIGEEMRRRGKECDQRERWEKIMDSRSNKWYGRVKEQRGVVPGYLRKGWGESRWRRVARYRMGNEVRESRY